MQFHLSFHFSSLFFFSTPVFPASCAGVYNVFWCRLFLRVFCQQMVSRCHIMRSRWVRKIVCTRTSHLGSISLLTISNLITLHCSKMVSCNSYSQGHLKDIVWFIPTFIQSVGIALCVIVHPFIFVKFLVMCNSLSCLLVSYHFIIIVFRWYVWWLSVMSAEAVCFANPKE